MKMIVRYFFLLLVFTIALAAQSAKKFVQIKDDNEPKITVKIWFKVGSQDDPKGKEGLAYLTGRMLSEGGTVQRDYNQILNELFPIAAEYNASVSTEMTLFGGSVHKDNVKLYQELLIDQLLNLGFAEADFERIKQASITYLSTTLKYSSDEELGKAVLYNKIFSGQPYAHTLQGTLTGLESISLEDVRRFYSTYFNRNNFVIGLSGGYSNDLPEKLDKALAQLPEGTVNNGPVFKANPLSGRQVTIIEKKTAATAISIGYPINVLRGDKDFYALSIANSWLGEHRNSSSHLYQVIREKRGLNYGDYSYIEHFPNGGRFQLPNPNAPRKNQIFEIWIRPVPNETRLFALRAALREFEDLVSNGMTKEEFETTKKFLKDYVLHYATTLSKRLGYALDDQFYGLYTESHLKKFRTMMETLTLEDVNSAIKQHFSAENLQIVFITENAVDLHKALLDETPSPITYTSPKSGEILEEDKLIAVFPVRANKEKIEILQLEDLFNK